MTRKKHLRHGGMRLGNVSGLPEKPTDIEIIQSLISNVERCSVISDSSKYSIVVGLTMRDFDLIDTYEKDKEARVKHFCVKLSLVNFNDDAKHNYKKDKKDYSKNFMSITDANKETQCQKRIFDSFECKGAKAIVPDIIRVRLKRAIL